MRKLPFLPPWARTQGRKGSSTGDALAGVLRHGGRQDMGENWEGSEEILFPRSPWPEVERGGGAMAAGCGQQRELRRR